jgi:hypothetical protein
MKALPILRSLDLNRAAGIVPEKIIPRVCGFAIRDIGLKNRHCGT